MRFILIFSSALRKCHDAPNLPLASPLATVSTSNCMSTTFLCMSEFFLCTRTSHAIVNLSISALTVASASFNKLC